MPRARRIGIRMYRGHRLEVVDDGGSGWAVSVYGARQSARARAQLTLRNAVPNGLEELLQQAHQYIDRVLDGPPWAREP